jgi:hypothetical protein
MNGSFYVGSLRIAESDTDEEYTDKPSRVWSGLGRIITAVVATVLRLG